MKSKIKNSNLLQFIISHKMASVCTILCGMAAAGGLCWFLLFKPSAQNIPEPEQTITLEKQDLMKTVSVTGSIASAKKVVLSSELTELKVLKLYVKPGDEVKAGDMIAQLDPTSIEDKLLVLHTSVNAAAKKLEIDQAVAARNLENARQVYETDVKRTQESVAKAGSAYENAKAEKERNKSSYEQEQGNAKEKENALNSLRSEKETVKADLDKLGSSISELQSQQNINLQEQKKQEKEKLEAELPALEEAARQAVSAYENSAAVFEALARDEEQTAEVIEAARMEMGEKEGLMKEAKTLLENAGIRKTQLETEMSDYQDTLEQTKKAYEQKEAEYKKKEESVASYEESVAGAKESISAKESAYKQSQSTVSTAENDYQKSVQAKEDAERNNTKAVADWNDGLSSLLVTAESGSIQEKMDIKKYERQLEACIIKAPCSGVITSAGLKEGEIYKGGELVTIQDINHFIASATVDQYDIGKVEKDMQVQIQTDTTGGNIMNGRLSFISPVPKAAPANENNDSSNNASNSVSSEYPVEIAVFNPDARLRLGMKAKINIITAQERNAFVVPYNCIQEGEGGKKYITVMDNEQKKNIYIECTLETDYYAAVKGEGLQENMLVLVPAEISENTIE